VSCNANVNPTAFNNDLPVIITSRDQITEEISYLVRCDRNIDSTRAFMTTNPSRYEVEVAAGSRFTIVVPDELVGTTITFCGIAVDIIAPGEYEWRVAPDPAIGTVVTSTLVPVGAFYNDFAIDYRNNVGNRGYSSIRVIGSGSYLLTAGLDTYSCWQAPQITSLQSGGFLKKYLTTSASVLLGMDASNLANGGYINALTNESPAIPPPGVSFEDWVSGASSWYYKGKAKEGSYQIYIPDVSNSLQTAIDRDFLTPFTGDRFYNMIITVNNSFNNGGGIPVAMQTHLTYESILASTDLSVIVPAVAVIEDPGFRVAIALLRKYYNPACNPDHFDAMASWLKNVMSDLQNYGSKIIHSPVTQDLAKSFVTKAVPFLIKSAPAAISAISSLL
jgi:hypothetical protein